MNLTVGRLMVLLCLTGAWLTLSADEPPRDPPPASFLAASPALAASVQGMLEEGFVVGPRRLQAAQEKLAAARKLAEGDPRLDYAYGLVLLKQSQNKLAIAQFEAAVGRKGPAYWPAWQALVWTQFVEKQYDKGLDRLEEFAALVRKSAAEPETTEPQRDAARWMGQVLEAVVKTVPDRKELRDRVDRHDIGLRDALGEDLLDELELGRRIVDERDLELSHLAGQAKSAAEEKQARRKQSETGRLESNLKDLGKEKANTAKSADDWKKWLEDNLAKADKQLGSLEKEYQFLEQRSKSINDSMILLGREITALELQLSGGIGRAPGTTGPQIQQQLNQRQNTMLNYQLEYNATVGRMSQIAEQGRGGMLERGAIVEKYEKATGELVKKNAALEKWSARVADKKKKLEVQPITKAKGAKAAPVVTVASFKSYVPLDLDTERARVLEAYGVKSAVPAAGVNANAAKK